MILIDGKKTAADLREELKKEVLSLKDKHNKVPGLTVILIGDLAPSQIYVRNKEKSANEVGLKSEVIRYPDSVEENEVLKNPDLNVTAWKNEECRTQGEILGAETFLKKDQYDGGNSDNGDAIIEIETLLRERKFIEASEVITKHFENGDIRKSTFIDYQNVRLPNAWDYDENVWFDKPIIAQTIYSLQKTMETGRGKDRIDAGHVTKYLKDKMFKWLKAAEINETYIKNPSLKA